MADQGSKSSGETALAEAIATADAARQAGAATPAAAAETREAVMLFSVGAVDLAIAASAVELVNTILSPTWVPLCPPHILGLVNIGERVIAELDLAQLLRIEAATSAGSDDLLERRMLVASAGGLEAAIVVDRISGLVEVPTSAMQPPSVFKGRAVEQFLRAEFVHGTKSTGLLDLPAVLEGSAVR